MNETYIWVKPRLTEPRYLVRCGNENFGDLTFAGVMTTTAHARLGGHEWTFQREGLMKPVVRVRRAGETADAFVVKATMAGNYELEAADGQRYRWKATRVLKGEFAWLTEDGVEMIRYRSRVSSFHAESDIEVLSDTLPLDVRFMLVLLGGYFLALTYSDVATTTAAVMAATIVS